MRRSRKNLALAALLFIGALYLLSHSDLHLSSLKRSPNPILNDVSWKAEMLADKNSQLYKDSWVSQGGYLPLNVSYQLLAGAPPAQSKYLSIGISSVKRTKGSYLIQTLQSLFSQSSPEERSLMVVIVLLADFDSNWRVTTVGEIKTKFASELEQFQLVVIHVNQIWYPPLTGLKRNYNDAPDRVSFRSKQNVDYSFLAHFSYGLGQYYLQLEDDISSAKNFLTAIRRRVEEQNAKNNWATLEFSALGYIGKLYKSTHLPLLARFLFLFYQEMPCDWLMSHFRELLAQKESFIFKPSLFQHMGTFSSFKGTYNKLKDKDFEEGVYTNPSAMVYSDMSTYKTYVPKLAWDAGKGFFWGRAPSKGNYLTVVFTNPTVLTAVFIETGSEGKDLLQSAQVEVGHDVIKTLTEEQSCKKFVSVGRFENGRFEVQGMEKQYRNASSCLRIHVTAEQKDWVVITKIRVLTLQTTHLMAEKDFLEEESLFQFYNLSYRAIVPGDQLQILKWKINLIHTNAAMFGFGQFYFYLLYFLHVILGIMVGNLCVQTHSITQ